VVLPLIIGYHSGYVCVRSATSLEDGTMMAQLRRSQCSLKEFFSVKGCILTETNGTTRSHVMTAVLKSHTSMKNNLEIVGS